MSLEEMIQHRKTWSGLLKWYGRRKRDLPWRVRRGLTQDEVIYRVWISEIMLQQTTVAAVIPYFERFLARFPDVRALASASESEVLKSWAGLGYYSRARNLKRAAEVVVAAGGFPESVDTWRELPGIGPYTAGAVASIALGLPAALVDGNVERVLSRLFRVRDKTPGKKTIWELAENAVKETAAAGGNIGDFNQALMELGATVCRPESPACELCPMESACEAKRAGDIRRYPFKKVRRKMVDVTDMRTAFLDSQGRVLLEMQTGESAFRWLKGLWDLPTSSASESKRAVTVLEVKSVITHHKILRKVSVVRASPRRRGNMTQKWVDVADPQVALGSAARKTLRKLLRLL